jgi:DNA mismatch endonuclease (patch repair protein)
MMSGIRGKNTRPEIRVRSLLHREGLRFRLGSKKLIGRPDIVLPAWNSVVFVHGCFWHRHANCRFCYTPKSNREFWTTKFENNVTRDARVARSLRAQGWRVFTVWSCQVTDARIQALANRIRKVTQ